MLPLGATALLTIKAIALRSSEISTNPHANTQPREMSNNTDTRTDNDEPEPDMPNMSWLNNPGITVRGTITVVSAGPGSIVIDRGRGRTEIVPNGARVQAWTATGGTGPRTFTRMDGNEVERRFPFANSHTSAMASAAARTQNTSRQQPNPALATAASADVPQTNPPASEESPAGDLNGKALPDAGDAPPSTGDFIDALD
ncbi:hypothetical protein DFP72DRAFT_1072821 [Ephemerocybe angulata]|uniref:Uncharacterized protein n=1 Tax=Ephemerocybe angulata TaxID=980116 RepID=A0A8H6LZJ7_9AGAR|nr:hypothetical protein DFP72DRAFT_1072821 [Tulosesus angulatus]